MNFRSQFVAAAFVIAAMPASALDPAHAPSQYVVRKWGVDDLRGNTVHVLLQTGDRYLWMGTSAGLLRYDGSRFVLFNARNTQALGDGGVSALAEAPDGTLYIGTTSGAVVRLRHGVFKTTGIPSGSARVTALIVDRAGHIWSSSFGTNVNRWKEGHVLLRSALNMQRAGAFVEDPQGGIWAGSNDEGVFFRRGDDVQVHAFTTDAVQALRFDHEGQLWIGTATGLLRRGTDGTIRRFGTRDGMTSDNVTAIVEDRDRNVWVGTKGGLNRWTDGRWTHVTRSFDRLSDDDVRSLVEDHEGNLWVGTADGLNRLSNGSFVTYGRPEGLPEDAIASVAPGRDARVWAGTDGGTLLRLGEGKIDRFVIPNLERGRDVVLSLREMADRSLWFTLDSQRILRLADGQLKEYRRPSTSAASGSQWTVRAFAEGDDGEPLFLVTGLGVARYSPSRNTFDQVIPGGPKTVGNRRFPRFPHQLVRDGAGAVWFCDRGGLARFKDGRWTLFDETNGLPHERVRWATVDETGAVWAATAGGLGYVKDDVARAVTVKEGLPEGYLRLVLDDGHGFLWIASTGNVFRLEKKQIFDLFAGRVAQVEPRVFDTSDGLRTTEILLSNNPGFRGEDGRLWFATAKGISVVDPAKLTMNTVPPAVHIEEVTVDDKAYGAKAALDAPPGRGDLTVRYAGLSYTVPHRVRFQYMLEGH
jgi:ligand-binding sensor domain-containing protein